jgi:hypothetical protein
MLVDQYFATSLKALNLDAQGQDELLDAFNTLITV